MTQLPLEFLDTPGMRALGGATVRGERLMVRVPASGGTGVCEVSAVPLVGDDGRVFGAVVMDRVVDDGSRSASGFVHDVNNALNTIMAAAFLLQHRADSPDAVRDYAGRIQQAAESGAAAAAAVERIVRQMPSPASSQASAAPSGDRTGAPLSPTPTPAPTSTPTSNPTLAPVTEVPLDILLVEDDDDGRAFISRLLRSRGHRVDAVATCAEARERLVNATPGPMDVMLTDVELPDGNGWALADYARARRSSLRIGVMSGWDVGVGSAEAVSADFVLRKPLRAAALLDHIAGRPAPALPE